MLKVAFDFTGKQSQTTSNDFHQVLMYLIKQQSRVTRLYLDDIKVRFELSMYHLVGTPLE